MATWVSSARRRIGSRAEAALLVAGLPVRLEQEVAHQVGDDENGEDFYPGQGRDSSVGEHCRGRLSDATGYEDSSRFRASG